MKSVAKTLTVGLLSLFVVSTTACEPDPLALDASAPQFARGGKGGSKDKPSGEDTSGDVTLVTYTVVSDVSAPHGLTNDLTVDADIYAALALEDPSVNWANYLGCPYSNAACSAVTIVMAGRNAVNFMASAVPIVSECGGSTAETCLHDTDLENRRSSTIRGGSAIPGLPWDIIKRAFVDDAEGNPTFTFYWQGQRGTRASWLTGEAEKYRGKIREIWETQTHWDLFPDLHAQGGPERFFFHPVWEIRDRLFHHPTMVDSVLLRICDQGPCWAEYQGQADQTFSTVEWVGSAEVTIGGVDYFEFGVKAVVTDNSNGNTNPESFGRVMLTHGGTLQMLDQRGTQRIDREDGTAATRYRVDVTAGGCYTFEVVGLVVRETQKATFADDDRWVWDGTAPDESLRYGCS